jgi:hypothetical protein
MLHLLLAITDEKKAYKDQQAQLKLAECRLIWDTYAAGYSAAGYSVIRCSQYISFEEPYKFLYDIKSKCITTDGEMVSWWNLTIQLALLEPTWFPSSFSADIGLTDVAEHLPQAESEDAMHCMRRSWKIDRPEKEAFWV